MAAPLLQGLGFAAYSVACQNEKVEQSWVPKDRGHNLIRSLQWHT